MLSNCDFVHTHFHGSGSSFDGMSKISEAVLFARRMGFRSLAITEHGNVGTAIEFARECKRTKDSKDKELLGDDGKILPTLRPILGIEHYLCRSRNTPNPDRKKGDKHLILLAKNEVGWKNICRLAHFSQTEGFHANPRIDFELLAKYSEGVVCSTACISSIVNSNILCGRLQEAKKAATTLKDIFKEDFFFEVMYHGIDAETIVIPEVFRLAEQMGVSCIASNDSHYLRKDQASSQEILMCMFGGCIKSEKAYKHPYPEFYLKSAEEMRMIFGSKPEVLSNTVALAERVEDFMAPHSMRLPKFPLPEGFKTPYEYLEKLAWDGLKRMGLTQSIPHVNRLKMELEDVSVAKRMNKMDFATYFLIVRDYVKFAKNEGIFVGSGRGSGFSSLLLRCIEVCYGPDPLKYGLIWERFLGFSQGRFVTEDDLGFAVDIETAKPIEALQLPSTLVSDSEPELEEALED